MRTSRERPNTVSPIKLETLEGGNPLMLWKASDFEKVIRKQSCPLKKLFQHCYLKLVETNDPIQLNPYRDSWPTLTYQWRKFP